MRALLFLLGLCAACGDDTPVEPQTDRKLVEIPFGGFRASVSLIRWQVRVPFGAGPGRGGFLDPAHDIFHLRSAIGVARADGSRVDLEYERFVADALLFEESWDTAETDDARARWMAAWDGTVAETCVVEPNRRLGIRVRGPGVGGAGWRVLLLEGTGWTSTTRSVAADCPSLVAEGATTAN